jgi:hypothetical protein
MRYFRPSAAQHRPPLKRAEADRFAAGVMPFIKQAQKAGAVTQQQIVDALNARGIPTARGGAWTRASVVNVMARG